MARATTLFVSLILSLATSGAQAQECRHTGQESAAEKTRRLQALNMARVVNTVQERAVTKNGRFFNETELREAISQMGKLPSTNAAPPIARLEDLAGWEFAMDSEAKSYWFMLSDKSDPCGFTYISSHRGDILKAEPLR